DATNHHTQEQLTVGRLRRGSLAEPQRRFAVGVHAFTIQKHRAHKSRHSRKKPDGRGGSRGTIETFATTPPTPTAARSARRSWRRESPSLRYCRAESDPQGTGGGPL